MDYNSSNNELTENLLNIENNSYDFKKTKNLNFNKQNANKDNNNKLAIKEWNNSIEDLLKSWGEKGAGLSIMHSKDRKYWRKKSNMISIASILITTLSSSLSLSSTSSNYYESIMYLVGFLGLVSSLMQSLKQFYNADEKASEHKLSSRLYGNFYRSIKLQLALNHNDRIPVSEFVNTSFKEYEKLLQDAPIINTTTIENFKQQFKSITCSKPDICGTDLIIEINRED
jgi:hypothetical protein